VVRRGTSIPYPDRAGWWRYGSTRIETARTTHYIVKYAQKAKFLDEQGDLRQFPPGCRIFAVWLSPAFWSIVKRWRFRLTAIPAWLATYLAEDFRFFLCSWLANPRGGWAVLPADKSPPVKFFSPWIVSLIRDPAV
jgi:hypothetical protein